MGDSRQTTLSGGDPRSEGPPIPEPAQQATDAKPRAHKPPEPTGSKDRFWIPRFWDGMCLTTWIGLIARNRFAVSPTRIPTAIIISLIGLLNSFLAALQWLIFSRRIHRTEIPEAPIFILGHWRSGTTLLHELLIRDPQHTYATTYECFAPNHFVLSSGFLPRMTRFLLPDKRPIDNMAAGWERPQEDEFALCNMGIPSPYLKIVFPNRPPQYDEYYDLRTVPPKALARWKEALVWFVKCVTLRRPKRIVLKSPPHTLRIRVLLELFPNARFIHIVRDPYVVFPSTVNLWKRLYRDQGLQSPKYDGLEERVFSTFNRMYEAFERQRGLIDPSRFCEVRYEDLVEDPVGQIERVYQQLGLDNFERARPAIEKYVQQQAGYKTNRYQISEATRAEITRRWSDFIDRYGYTS